jgi:hypothetical protein
MDNYQSGGFGKDGFFYHRPQLAPGVELSFEEEARLVREAIERNKERMLSPRGGKWDIDVRDLF